MEFQGHKLYKMNSNWVFDITDYIGYYIRLDSAGNVVSYVKAFSVFVHDSELRYIKYRKIPLGIMKMTSKLIYEYMLEACLISRGKAV